MRSFSRSILSSVLLALALGGCSLKPDTNVRLEIDIKRNVHASGAKEAPGSSFLRAPGFGESSFPYMPSEFNCYAVNVYGMGVGNPWQSGPGFDIHKPTKCRYPGITSEVLTGSSTFATELTVPSGPKRVVQVVGLFRQDMTCPAGLNLKDVIWGGDPLTEAMPIQLGITVTDLFEDTTVKIDSSYDYSDPLMAFGGCGYRQITQIAAGRAHTCVMVEDRMKLDDPISGNFMPSSSVYCFGDNTYGQLGDGTTSDRGKPVRVMMNPTTPLTSVVSIGVGDDHSCAIVRDFSTDSDTLYCWGYNVYGQLGVGDTVNRSYATYVYAPGGTMGNVDGGAGHTCFSAFSQTYCMGLDESGQLGDNASNTNCGGLSCQTAPVVASGAGGGRVAAGETHSCVAGGSGVSCWGQGDLGQLGDGMASNSDIPVAASPLTGDPITFISAGGNHTCVITSPSDPMLPSSMMCWGANNAGQVGDGTTTMRTTPVTSSYPGGYPYALATGYDHTCVNTSSGTYCMGGNAYGQLGNGTNAWTPTPVLVSGVSYAHSLAAGGSSSASHTCAISGNMENADIKCWGSNNNGQHGNGGTTGSTTPRSTGIKFPY